MRPLNGGRVVKRIALGPLAYLSAGVLSGSLCDASVPRPYEYYRVCQRVEL